MVFKKICFYNKNGFIELFFNFHFRMNQVFIIHFFISSSFNLSIFDLLIRHFQLIIENLFILKKVKPNQKQTIVFYD